MNATPHFAIFNSPCQPRPAANSNCAPGGASLPPPSAEADDNPGLYSRIERDALLLRFGEAADFEPSARDDVEMPAGRLWRFIRMLLPRYF